MSDDGFLTVGDAGAVAPGATARVVAGGEEIAIYNVGGEFFATVDVCSHDEASLSDGELSGHHRPDPVRGRTAAGRRERERRVRVDAALGPAHDGLGGGQGRARHLVISGLFPSIVIASRP